MNSRLSILALIFIASMSGATPAPAKGQSTLKLEATHPIREGHKALAAVEQDIANIDQEIKVIRTQALTTKSQAGSNGSVLMATLEAQSNSLELQKADLQIKQDRLKSELHTRE